MLVRQDSAWNTILQELTGKPSQDLKGERQEFYMLPNLRGCSISEIYRKPCSRL